MRKSRPQKHFTIKDVFGDAVGCVETNSERVLDGVRHAVEQGGGTVERSDRSLCEFCQSERVG